MATRSDRAWQVLFCVLVAAVVVAGATLWVLKERRFVISNDAHIEAFLTNVGSHILSQITGLYADEGQFVEEGQLLCTLDDSTFVARVQMALAEANAAEQRMVLAEVEVAKTYGDALRAYQAFEANLISAESYDHRLRAWQAAVSERDREEARKMEAIAWSQLFEAELAFTRIWAPADGFVAKRWHWLGDVVQNGQPILTLVDPSPLWVLAYLVETEVRRVAIGNKVQISVDAFPGMEFSGQIIEIDAAAATRFSETAPQYATWQFSWVAERIPVKISIKEPTRKWPRLLPGMSVEVRIDTR